MRGLLIFFLLWTPLCLVIVFGLTFFDLESRLNLGLIVWLIGGLLGFYYITARKWRQ